MGLYINNTAFSNLLKAKDIIAFPPLFHTSVICFWPVTRPSCHTVLKYVMPYACKLY